LAREKRERVVVEMEMQEVEVGGLLAYPFQHAHVQRVGVADGGVVAQRPRPHGCELRRRLRIAARKQSHIMAKLHHFLDPPMNDALGAAIALRRNRFGQWSYLRDAHENPLLVAAAWPPPHANPACPTFSNDGPGQMFP